MIKYTCVDDFFSDKTKVFIVHDDHCHLCRNVTHAFANVLNRIGYIECILDFCRVEEIASRGMGWYEHSIKGCDIIIVVCTKDGRKMYEEKQQDKGLCCPVISYFFTSQALTEN